MIDPNEHPPADSPAAAVATPAHESQTKSCPECGVSFSCGGNCWCFGLPAVFPMDAAADCLCPDCLTMKTSKRIQEILAHPTSETMARIRSLGPVSRPLRNIDYEVDAKGNWVFTAWYHLRRGECCGNLCKHCPYNGAPAK